MQPETLHVKMIQEGHRFDLGATILLMPSLYRKVFNALGLDLDKDLETTNILQKNVT